VPAHKAACYDGYRCDLKRKRRCGDALSHRPLHKRKTVRGSAMLDIVYLPKINADDAPNAVNFNGVGLL